MDHTTLNAFFEELSSIQKVAYPLDQKKAVIAKALNEIARKDPRHVKVQGYDEQTGEMKGSLVAAFTRRNSKETK
jgi:hypothetical protein